MGSPMPIAEVHAMLTAPGSPFELDEAVVRGVPLRVWKAAPPSLRAVLESSRQRGEELFLVYEDERVSYARHFAEVATLARRLVDDLGVQKGDRVAIAMRNFPEWSVAFWAATAAGTVAVPLNAWWTAGELEYGLQDSGSRVLFCDAERHDRLADRLGSLGLDAVVVARPVGPLAAGARPFDDVLGEVDPAAELPDVALDPDDDATIFYTSGTTGFPKGALGTHRNICTNLLSLAFGQARGALRSGADPAAPTGGGGQNAYLLSVPFFHATGCHSILVANLAFGGKIVIMYKWDPGRALELIERERVTTFGGVPSMVWEVLESPSLATRDISSVRSIGYGGAPAPPELVRRIEAMFPGRTPSNGYGLTETSSVTTINSGADYQRHPDSVGVPVPVVDVQVVDELGEPQPVGAVGELWIRGPNVVKGYWGKPEATAESFTDEGWFHSGDVARVDEEGFVFIVDRAKDMVIRGGENVYCSEVEAALFEHPAVTDAAVIGVPHQVLGEEVGAVVRLRAGASATVEELQDHVRERLAGFKVPAHIWVRDEELPRNPAGKVLKRALKDELVGA
ncbi:MAG TPA: class I adenylate-forming enzyme family protein [Acidimicrobiales bacterium]|nr:class I adenylate-forming enzyme family protein [Acidimicrobiales bacterium]